MSPFILNRSYNDIDELNESIRTWDFDFRQLERGRFQGDIFQFVGDTIQFGRGRFGRRLEQLGATPRKFRTFVIPIEPSARFHWRGKEVKGSNILVFPRSGELHALSTAGFGVYTISLQEEALANTCSLKGLPDLPELLGDREVLDCSPAIMRGLRHLCEQTQSRIEKAFSSAEHASLQKDLDSEWPCALLAALTTSAPAPIPPLRLRSKALHKSLEYVRAYPTEAVSVRDLVTVSGASWRTLDYAFREQLGITPKEYLKLTRFHGAHKELRLAKSSLKGVTEIATNWNFTHLGRFSSDYRKIFEELPSATLKRNRGKK